VVMYKWRPPAILQYLFFWRLDRKSLLLFFLFMFAVCFNCSPRLFFFFFLSLVFR